MMEMSHAIDAGKKMKEASDAVAQSMRKLAYDLQRTGNPRCEAEAMEIHAKLDGDDGNGRTDYPPSS